MGPYQGVWEFSGSWIKLPLCFPFASTLEKSTGLPKHPKYKLPWECMEVSIYFQSTSNYFHLTSKTSMQLPFGFRTFYLTCIQLPKLPF